MTAPSMTAPLVIDHNDRSIDGSTPGLNDKEDSIGVEKLTQVADGGLFGAGGAGPGTRADVIFGDA